MTRFRVTVNSATDDIYEIDVDANNDDNGEVTDAFYEHEDQNSLFVLRNPRNWEVVNVERIS